MKKLAVSICALFLGFNSFLVFAESEVNVYSYRQEFLMAPLYDAFTAETGITVNSIYLKKGLIERLVQEGDNSPADIILTVDIGRLTDAVKKSVTQSVESDVLNQNIPQQYRDPEGHWFGLTSRARMIVASKDRVDASEITSYEDLADEKFSGKICTRSGKHAYMVALTASIIAHAGEAAAQDWLAGVKNNLARKPQGNDRAQVKAINEGECDIAVINNYYMGKMLNDEKGEQQAWAESVNVIFPNQADRGTHMNISGIALTNAAPNKDNAIKLMEFLSSDDAQKIYAEVNYEYPVNPNVEQSELVQSWGAFKPDDLSLEKIAGFRSDASKLADTVGYDE